MRDSDCVAFLQWCTPRLGLRWAGFRKVRRTVCKRIARRVRDLGLADVAAYRSYLADHADEWDRLARFCCIPISRFWRDRAVFDWLATEAFPAFAAKATRRAERVVSCWSAGCASGEEPYSLRIAWAERAELAWPSVGIRIVASDVDTTMLTRAEAGRYSTGSVRELSPEQRDRAFGRDDDTVVLRLAVRRDVRFLQQDLRTAQPDGPFDLIFCRNAVFTYFDAAGQRYTVDRMARLLRPDGLLIVGAHEQLPEEASGFVRAVAGLPAYRRATSRFKANAR